MFDKELEPAEVISLCNNNEITRDEMMKELCSRTYENGSIPENAYDSYIRGTWDQILEAHLDGDITREEFKIIQDHHYG